jgi:RNA polymerase sigma factor (sigma-70 family)
MFPTTLWTTIRQAGRADSEALQRFAARYRPAVREYVRRKGFADSDAEDICQDVFVRVLSSRVLAGADPGRGRFRSLLLTITSRAIADRLRRRREVFSELPPTAEMERDPQFDAEWILNLAERAMSRLREDNSPYHQVLAEHLAGRKQDRQRLWIARRKLIALIRNEIALTCDSHQVFEREVAYLSEFLRPGGEGSGKNETGRPP